MTDMVRFPLSVFDGVVNHNVVLKMSGRTFYVPQDKAELTNGFVFVDARFWKNARRARQPVMKVKLTKPDWW
jgi:hypothetical protein